MTWLPQFAAWQYALAGAVCAVGPILIHLLNRRRYQLVQWGAMELLREALTTQQRMLRLRDWLLLALRVAAVLLFGLALARPYTSSGETALTEDTPRHLVLLIDNSLSMAFRTLDGMTLLGRARQQATELIESLPGHSRVSIVPICAGPPTSRAIAVASEDALRALQTVQIVDGTSRLEQLVSNARSALQQAEPLADQLVLISDMQRVNWPSDLGTRQLEALPKLLIRDVSVPQPSNTWVAAIRPNDPVVSPHMAAGVVATIRHIGPRDRQVQVALYVNGKVVASRSVKMAAGASARHVAFQYSVDDMILRPDQVQYLRLQVEINGDRLTLDDRRHLLMPVAGQLPVVFVDQLNAGQENVTMGMIGETWPMRQILMPSEGDRDGSTSLIQAHHVSLSGLDQSLLAKARLVVMAGVHDPADRVDLLRQYVEQGGQLIIAAGGGFDPDAWDQAAWLDGGGLLPGRLNSRLLGISADRKFAASDSLNLSVDGLLRSRIFRLPGVSEKDLRELYAEPIILRAVDVVLDEATRKSLVKAEAEIIWRRAGQQYVGGQPSPNDADNPPFGDGWLEWYPPEQEPVNWPADQGERQAAVRVEANRAVPRIHARLTDAQGPPLIIERQIGRGRVIFFASGFLPAWSTIAQTNAVVMLDRMARDRMQATLPSRNFLPQRQIFLELTRFPIGSRLQLHRPASIPSSEYLQVDDFGRRRAGVILHNLWDRGLYRLLEVSADSTSTKERSKLMEGEAARAGISSQQRETEGELTIAINGRSSESDLAGLRTDQMARWEATGQLRWLNAGETQWNDLLGTPRNSWWQLLIMVVFGLLLMELVFLTFPYRRMPTRE